MKRGVYNHRTRVQILIFKLLFIYSVLRLFTGLDKAALIA